MSEFNLTESSRSKIQNGSLDKEESSKITGYASIDRPWLKYYDISPEEVVIPEMGLYEFVYKNNQDNLDGIAINYYHKRITYREMFDMISKLTYSYKEMGIKENDNVAICSLTTPETIMSFFALNMIGASINMIDPRNGIEGLKNYIKMADSKYLLTLDIFSDKINSFINDTNIDKIISFSLTDFLDVENNNNSFNFNGEVINGKKLFGEEKYNQFLPYKNDRLASIVYTGGTTGLSKGVKLSNYNYVAMAYQYSKSDVCMKKGESFLSVIPPFFPYGICFSIYMPIALGSETILIPKFDASIFPNIVMEYKPNHIMGVPKYWENLMNSSLTKDSDLSFIYIAGCGGDGMNSQIEEEVNAFLESHNSPSKVMKGYGMTEVSSAATSNTRKANKVGSVGIPFICNNVSIFDPETGKELNYLENSTGEICICSPTMMLGYENNEEATNDLIRLHNDGKKWVHTGDCGTIDEEGNIYIKGRYKRIIVRRGLNIYPSIIENIIAKSIYVKEVAVVKKDDKNLVNIPVAIIVLKEECLEKYEVALEEIERLCHDSLPDYSLPEDYVIVDKLPLTKMGKIDYLELEDNLKKNSNSKTRKLML